MLRAFRQVWMRRLDDASAIDAVLRHPAFRDRAVLEKALSNRFFAPFAHQEVVTGPRFEARARFSRAALAGVPLDRVEQAARAACDAAVVPGVAESLLDAVRGTVARATCDLVLGEGGDWDLVARAVADIDRGIKMVGRASMPLRRELARMLERRLADPDGWNGVTYLTAAREEGRALSLEERVDHVASVFLATGTIQVSDVVTHALIALAQHPAAAAATDEAVVHETIRAYPVNSSITRVASYAAAIAGLGFQRGEPVTVVPERLAAGSGFDPFRTDGAGHWAFGAGPRACPARRVALTLAATILGRYRAAGVRIEPAYEHKRSLALPVRATIGDGPDPAPTGRLARLGGFARYVATSIESYPAAFLIGWPDLVRALRDS
jgi:cytochrome P450